MKTKRTFLSILTLCIALLFTACSGKGTADTEKSQNTKTESGSKSADDSDSKLNDLYQQENQIFADHEDVWNKAFGMMSKSERIPIYFVYKLFVQRDECGKRIQTDSAP